MGQIKTHSALSPLPPTSLNSTRRLGKLGVSAKSPEARMSSATSTHPNNNRRALWAVHTGLWGGGVPASNLERELERVGALCDF